MAAADCQLSIDLSAIANNWQSLKDRLHSAAECSAVVKANAYGLGVEPVAEALWRQGCRSFFVATLAEALTLPQNTVNTSDIYILGGLRPGEEAACLNRSFIPVLSTSAQVERWVQAARNFDGDFRSTIKVDTGMSRLGLMPEEFAGLCRGREGLRGANPVVLMSHLACADEPGHALNGRQLIAFRQAAERMREAIPEIKLSLANSSGIFLGPDYHFDLVRPGASLYGVNPTPDRPNPMQPVVTLRLPILQIKSVSGPATVGYGSTYSIAEGETNKLAIVQGGYGDGIFRYLGNRGFGVVDNRRVPVVGRVSMDTIAFDISEVEAELVEEGDSIALIGDGIGIDDIAAWAGTIGYEVLTALGHRYRRHYVNS